MTQSKGTNTTLFMRRTFLLQQRSDTTRRSKILTTTTLLHINLLTHQALHRCALQLQNARKQ